MSDELEQSIREADLEAGWQRYAGLKWRAAPPLPADRMAARDAFGAGMAWMFEILMNLGERPHEFASRVVDVRQRLHGFALHSRLGKFN